ncbi:MAG TPA: hypothetical protein EYH34_19420 [Planctomycetes bacterium]|nr:hypothetical protein [Planctomycetota bacterium]
MKDTSDDRARPSAPETQPAECAADACCCGGLSRRTFIQLAGAAASWPAVGELSGATRGAERLGSRKPLSKDHFVPVDKKLRPEWLKALFARGQSTWYCGKELETIAMPVGGVCAGQLYLAGDGRLMHWDIFNQHHFSGYGRENYQVGRRPESPLEQGFAITVQTDDKTVERTLDSKGFPGVRFCGEYPIGYVEYRDESVPVSVTLEAFSPFIPLNAPDSALPATVLRFTLKNRSSRPVQVTLTGWLENGVCLHSARVVRGARVNRVVRGEGFTMVSSSAKSLPPAADIRQPIVLADFESDDYGHWIVEGEAFGDRPARGTLPRQQEVTGFQGRGLVNTFFDGDRPQGKLTSPPFRIERPFINFLIGGGKHKDKTCINLVVEGKVVRSAVGENREKLEWRHWDVRQLAGKEAHIEIVDRESGPWGHINVDHIELADKPRAALEGPLEEQADFGTMGLAVLESGPQAAAAAMSSKDDGFRCGGRDAPATAEVSFDERLIGAVEQKVRLEAGEEAAVPFVVAWHFPNRPERGNYYATRFRDAAGVVAYVAENFQRLAGQTRLWHDTWYDSTLPHWLLDRLFSTVSTLATSTCQWWANGRFWGWEGVGCCRGTCAHVWNYEHAMARLFPRLERSVREMQDFDPEAGFVEETGMVRFRGEGWKMWAGDGQAGTVLKAYREHQMSADDRFLRNNWKRIKKALEFLIREDGDDDGLLEGSQHNTYDINFFGPNTMVGSLYLAALRAAEEMAAEVGDEGFAKRCRALFDAGSQLTAQELFNGEYFVQQVDLDRHPKHQYADGCLSDQLFGQGWAHQVALGYVYPRPQVTSALEAIWRYNWAPDVGPQNAVHKPERWFAYPGEAGLFTCTWPYSPHLAEGVRYKNEVWTGIEYQVAGHMAWEGMLTECLAICRAVHERYHPSKRNPWNEVECGDHYARGMASYGVFLGLCGFEYHGPRRHLGFAPRLGSDDFRAAFTAAEGWGTISQKRSDDGQTNRIDVHWGRVVVKTLAFELASDRQLQSATVRLAGRPLAAETSREGPRVQIELAEPVAVEEGQSLEVRLAN